MHIIGLPNLGGSCYFNSCLQTLLYNTRLYRILTEHNNVKHNDEIINHFYTLQSMCINNLQMNRGEFCSVVKKLYNEVITKSAWFQHGQQGDAVECIQFLLEHFHEQIKRPVRMTLNNRNTFPKDQIDAFDEWKKQYSNEYSGIIRCFHGQYQSILVCVSCQKKTYRYESFGNIALAVDDTCNTVDDCMRIHTNPEEIEGSCEYCKSMDSRTRTLQFCILPKFLCIKLRTINYKTTRKQEINIDKILQTKLGTYHLVSIIYHEGALNSGHYYTYNNLNKKHVMLNDKSIHMISETEVSSQNACVLWYRMVDSN